MMADVTSSIFNKKATEKLRSPDDLDKYVRVTKPSVWAVLVACIALLAGLLAWGVFGVVTTSVTATGAVIDVSNVKGIDTNQMGGSKAAVVFLTAEDVANVSVGDDANVGGVQMQVAYVSPIPASPDEWDAALGSEYLVKALFTGDWAYPVAFKGDISELQENLPISVTITTDRISPISLILKNWG